tara:strand:- start:10966 stop:11406 length:441 start_codon:yes stop_codon:yes gene_type:complete
LWHKIAVWPRQLPKNCQLLRRVRLNGLKRVQLAELSGVSHFKLVAVAPKQSGIWTQTMRSPVLDVEKTMFNNIGLPGLLLIAVVVLVLFGRGKISSLMGEVGKGITSFKKGINEGEEDIKNASDDTAELSDDSAAVTEIKTDKDKV